MTINHVSASILAVSALALFGCSAQNEKSAAAEAPAPEKIIFETDLGNDVDDVMAMDMLYKYADEGKVDLLAIMINKPGEAPAKFADILNTWYGHPEVPVGVLHQGADCENDGVNYAKAVVNLKNQQGQPMFAGSNATPFDSLTLAPVLYRQILAAEPDSSVTIVSVGFSTNLAALLQTPADSISPLTGSELVARKVKNLYTMAGSFGPDGSDSDTREYNIIRDVPAAKIVFEQWPTTIITSPFEVGQQIQYPGSSIANDFGWAPEHPMVEAYKSYLPMPYDRPTWDLTALLCAVEGPEYFSVSQPGTFTVTPEGNTRFVPDSLGNRYFLSVDSVQAAAINQHFQSILPKQPASRTK